MALRGAIILLIVCSASGGCLAGVAIGASLKRPPARCPLPSLPFQELERTP